MNDDIEARLQQLERDNAELRDRIARMEGERGRIRSGLSKILNTIMGKQTKHDQQIAEQDGRIGALETWRQEIATPAETKGSDTGTLNQLRLLRYLINQHFNDEELRGLVFDLGIDYDSLRRNGKDTVVRDLITYMERRGRLGKLTDRCRELRPDVPNWPAVWDVEWI